MAKSLAALPFHIGYATLYTSIVYFMIGMNQIYYYKFLICRTECVIF